MQDHELLVSAAAGSREALGAIAQRYAPFVYSAAVRQVGDAHLAEDVTQAVFLILARKIRQIRSGTVLPSWLFTTTRYAANNAKKMQARRNHYEMKAATARLVQSAPDAVDASVLKILDDALASLPEKDRRAVLLSYFADKGWRDVGLATGTSEDAARKRVQRAIERMRSFFARRGVAVGASGLILAMQSSTAEAVPDHLMRSINMNMLSAPTSTTTATTIAQGVIHMMQLMKLKLAAAAVAVSIACLGGGLLAVGNADQQSQQPPAAPEAPPAQTAVNFGANVRVELLGISAIPAEVNGWWNPDGRTVAAPLDESETPLANAQFQAAVLVEAPKDSSTAMVASPARMVNTGEPSPESRPPGATRVEFLVENGQATVDLFVRLGSDPLKTLLECPNPGEGATARFKDSDITVAPLEKDGEGRAQAVFHHELADHDVRVIATTVEGKELPAATGLTHDQGGVYEYTVSFDAPPEKIRSLKLQARPLDKWVVFGDLTLDPTRKQPFQLKFGTDPTTMPGR